MTASCGGDPTPSPTQELPASLFDVSDGSEDVTAADVVPVLDTVTIPDTGPDVDGAGDQDTSTPGTDAAQGADAVVAEDTASAPWTDPAVWFVHISDTHLDGAGGRAAQQLAYVLSEVMPAVSPVALLHTGDLVDDGGAGEQWAAYDAVMAAAPAYPETLELVGNHDKKNDGGDDWLAHALTGRAGQGFLGQHFYETPAGRVRVVRADTSDSSWNATNVVGFYSDEQHALLTALQVEGPPPVATLLLGHHPMTGLGAMSLLGSGDRMRALMARVGAAAYLCGHVHEPELAELDGVAVVQAPSLGKAGLVSRTMGFALVALDAGRPVARVVTLDTEATPAMAWPLVMRLRPEDVPPTYPAGTSIEVRALAFAPQGILRVEARIDGGPWVSLAGDGAGRFRGVLPPRWVPGGATIEVQAVSPEGVSVDSLRVVVAP